MDALLKRVAALVARRGRSSGEPVYLALAASLWLLRRAIRNEPVTARIRLKPGERIVVRSLSDTGHE